MKAEDAFKLAQMVEKEFKREDLEHRIASLYQAIQSNILNSTMGGDFYTEHEVEPDDEDAMQEVVKRLITEGYEVEETEDYLYYISWLHINRNSE